ncbi:unnamed protein product [Angiostrongylus costaricensis]|uniref:Uncharacterized protein n=1 Tax=Angiostrongylus costaricensis TaxID=334426 RepID=A0A0R3PD16_ANGCS|nr:unnamed protein product [Angiostrongylus costaricensis]
MHQQGGEAAQHGLSEMYADLTYLAWTACPHQLCCPSIISIFPSFAGLAKVCPRSSPPQAVAVLEDKREICHYGQFDTKTVENPGSGLVLAGLPGANAKLNLGNAAGE